MDEADTFHTCLGHYPLYKLCFCFGQVRTLIAVATFFIVMFIPTYLSGEQLQDHWSSGKNVLNKISGS